MDVHASIEEKLDALVIALTTCIVNNRSVVGVDDVDVCASIEKRQDLLHRTSTCSIEQRSLKLVFLLVVVVGVGH